MNLVAERSGGRSRLSMLFGKGRTLLIGFVMLFGIFAVVFFWPAAHDPHLADPSMALTAPGGLYPLGTDQLGRDMWARTLSGGRTDLPLALVGTVLSLAIGIPMGLAASVKGRMAEIIMRFLDLLQAFPLLIIALLFVALSQSDRGSIVMAIVLVGTPQLVRIVRNDAMIVRQRRFVEAATTIGSSAARTFALHVVPNLLPTLVAQTSLIVGRSLSVISALTFLGFGVQPPTASWGSMVREGLAPLQAGAWWVSVIPGMAVFLTIVATNQFAYGLRRVAEE